MLCVLECGLSERAARALTVVVLVVDAAAFLESLAFLAAGCAGTVSASLSLLSLLLASLLELEETAREICESLDLSWQNEGALNERRDGDGDG